MTSRRGPRGAGSDTRADILEAARSEFAAKGYDATSVRGVARAAGVDPALVHHYFAGKAGLFADVVGIPEDPSTLMAEVLDGPEGEVGEQLARTFFRVWDSPEGRVRFQGIARSAMGHDGAARMIQEFVAGEIFGRVAVTLAGRRGRAAEEVRVPAGLAAGQMVGLALLRYVIELPELVDADVDELVDLVAPTLQRYLVGE